MVAALSLVGGCTGSGQGQARTWETYQNPLYGFEFLYPSDWRAVPLETGREGQQFEDPRQPQISMSGWASQRSEVDSTLEAIPDWTPNITTEQGLKGRLQVHIESDVSRMELVVMQDGVIYRWEGRSPTDLFDEHYRFFDYVARHYQVHGDASSPVATPDSGETEP